METNSMKETENVNKYFKNIISAVTYFQINNMKLSENLFSGGY